MVFPAQLDLTGLNATNGYVIRGLPQRDGSGTFLNYVGDINSDGIADFIVGESKLDPMTGANLGGSYVVFGSAGALTRESDLMNLDGSNGFYLKSTTDMAGLVSASGIGDVNGDGLDDLIVAEYDETRSYAKSYVVFGRKTDFAAQTDLSSLDGTIGFALKGPNVLRISKQSVSAAGDVNGDGLDDILIGDRSVYSGAYNAGQSYVIFGTKDGFDAEVELASLNGSNGFKIDGANSFDFTGSDVSGTGDVNGDGLDDLIIRGYRESYVVFGRRDGVSQVNLATLDGSNGFSVGGINAVGSTGSVSGAGDVNGDGTADILIGIPGELPIRDSVGRSFVIFGRKSGFEAQIDLSKLNGQTGFSVKGQNIGDRLGSSVGEAGDVNGDGFGDIVIGADGADPNGNNNAGVSYVVLGRQTFDADLDLSKLDGADGFTVTGTAVGAGQGHSVSSVGDVNGDNVDDLLVGQTRVNSNGMGSESYIVFGQPRPSVIPVDSNTGTEGADTLNGTPDIDKLSGQKGDDVLRGRGGNDFLRGGGGNDVISGGSGNDRLTGGQGLDTLTGGTGQDKFVFLNRRQGKDVISDFDPTEDRIFIKASGFYLNLPKGKLSQARFTVGAAAVRRSDRFIYNDRTGALLFDNDGSRASQATVIAMLSPRLDVTASNISLF